MDARQIEKSYVAIDTFEGFVENDVKYEISKRGKRREYYRGFQVNKQKWVDGTMALNGITRVTTIRTDVNRFDFSVLGPMSFCLLDVDLYQPTRRSLPELYRILSPGGIIVVDDCDPNDVSFDGANEAYREFTTKIGASPRVVHDKLGIIEKPD